MAKDQEPIDRIEDLIRPLFPPTSLIRRIEQDGAATFEVAWRLGTSRMDNWSKEIHLVLPADVLGRYGKLNEKGRFKAEANLVSFTKLKLSAFHPEHDRPRYLLPPVEVWEASFGEIFPSKA